MPQATASNPYAHLTQHRIRAVTEPPAIESVTVAMAEIGSVIYFARTAKDVIKIGYTTDLNQRRSALGVKWADVLAVISGATRRDEYVMHRKLQGSRHHGHEYYRVTPEVMAAVNAARQACGQPALVAKKAS